MPKACVAGRPTAFTDDAQLDRIRHLADGDRRIVGAGSQDQIILDDELFRVEARKVLRALTVHPTWLVGPQPRPGCPQGEFARFPRQW